MTNGNGGHKTAVGRQRSEGWMIGRLMRPHRKPIYQLLANEKESLIGSVGGVWAITVACWSKRSIS